MEVKVVADTKVLIPNKSHQNFTEGREVIQAGTIIEGQPKLVEGLRRGEPFQYKLFLTNDNKLIYLTNLRTMDATEVKLGADSTVSPTTVNLKQNTLARPSILGAVGGAVVLFGYAKWKKHDMKKIGVFVLVGAVTGYVIGKVIEHRATIKPSK